MSSCLPAKSLEDSTRYDWYFNQSAGENSSDATTIPSVQIGFVKFIEDSDTFVNVGFSNLDIKDMSEMYLEITNYESHELTCMIIMSVGGVLQKYSLTQDTGFDYTHNVSIEGRKILRLPLDIIFSLSPDGVNDYLLATMVLDFNNVNNGLHSLTQGIFITNTDEYKAETSDILRLEDGENVFDSNDDLIDGQFGTMMDFVGNDTVDLCPFRYGSPVFNADKSDNLFFYGAPKNSKAVTTVFLNGEIANVFNGKKHLEWQINNNNQYLKMPLDISDDIRNSADIIFALTYAQPTEESGIRSFGMIIVTNITIVD